MSRLVCAVALVGAAWAGTATAQDFKGAELSAEVLSFTDDGDIAQTTYRGSLEFGVFGGFGLAADLSFNDFGDDGDGVRNVTVHALYDAFALATLGAFYSRESYGDDLSADSFGIEAKHSFGSAGVEGYLGFVDDEGADYRIFGLDGSYDITRNISVTGVAALIDGDDGSANRLAIGSEYRFGEGPALYAEIGRIDVNGDVSDDSETYLGLGARIAIGPNNGTTFESRGFTETLSGL